eukprot:1285864-Rhodomonas_salina.2
MRLLWLRSRSSLSCDAAIVAELPAMSTTRPRANSRVSKDKSIMIEDESMVWGRRSAVCLTLIVAVSGS